MSTTTIVWPIDTGSFERSNRVKALFADPRWWTQVVQDAMRAVDYLDTRSDMDVRRLGFLGQSLGAAMGPFITALDPRVKAAIFYHGGLFRGVCAAAIRWRQFCLPNPLPVLMINGQQGGAFPVATSQRPMYHFLGTRPDEKVWMSFDGGHGTDPKLWLPDAQAWYDLFLGPLDARSDQRQLKATANFAAIRGDWTAAAEAMVEALDPEVEPDATANDRGIQWMRAAVLLLLAGDHDGYQKLCTRMVEQFADSEDPEVWERVVKTCSLDSSAAHLPEEQLEKPSRALSEGILGEPFRFWATVALALSAQRLGDAEKSLALMVDLDHSRLDESLASLAHAVAALAHHDLGQTESAQKHLATAAGLIDDTLPRREDGTLDPGYLMKTQRLRHDWLIAEWIRKQADVTRYRHLCRAE